MARQKRVYKIVYQYWTTVKGFCLGWSRFGSRGKSPRTGRRLFTRSRRDFCQAPKRSRRGPIRPALDACADSKEPEFPLKASGGPFVQKGAISTDTKLNCRRRRRHQYLLLLAIVLAIVNTVTDRLSRSTAIAKWQNAFCRRFRLRIRTLPNKQQSAIHGQ